MRYFKTTNALRPYVVDGRRFQFDMLRLIGGLYSGVAVVEDNEFADKLANLKGPVSEISVKEYEDLKKKAPYSNHTFSNSQTQPRPAPKSDRPAASVKSEPVVEVAKVVESELVEDVFSTGDIENPFDHLDSLTDKKKKNAG